MSSQIFFKLINLIIFIIPILSSDIINLNEDNFDKEVYKSNEIWIVEIYSEKCESCKSFEPKWNQLIKKINYLNIGRINVDEKKGINVANKLNALDNGIPSIKLIISQSETFDIMTGIEEPFPNANTLKKRIDKILKEKGKLSDLKNSNENEL